MDPYKIVKYPISTEKAIRLMESQNKLVFVVDIDANKMMVKQAVQDIFKVAVDNVQTRIFGGEKRAYVTFNQKNPAIDVATQLGLM